MGSSAADRDFARRSAHYLAESGCTSDQIIEALIEQLELNPVVAVSIVAAAGARTDGPSDEAVRPLMWLVE